MNQNSKSLIFWENWLFNVVLELSLIRGFEPPLRNLHICFFICMFVNPKNVIYICLSLFSLCFFHMQGLLIRLKSYKLKLLKKLIIQQLWYVSKSHTNIAFKMNLLLSSYFNSFLQQKNVSISHFFLIKHGFSFLSTQQSHLFFFSSSTSFSNFGIHIINFE